MIKLKRNVFTQEQHESVYSLERTWNQLEGKLWLDAEKENFSFTILVWWVGAKKKKKRLMKLDQNQQTIWDDILGLLP